MSTEDKKPNLEDMDVTRIMEILPHRYPMLMIDKIINITENDGATGVKNVTMNEPFFVGHFPQKPFFPGVFIVEAMAQTAAAYVAQVEDVDTSNQVVLFMGIDKARFRRPVGPGDQLLIPIKVEQRRPPVWRFSAKAMVDGKTVAEASFAAMLTVPPEEKK